MKPESKPNNFIGPLEEVLILLFSEYNLNIDTIRLDFLKSKLMSKLFTDTAVGYSIELGDKTYTRNSKGWDIS